MNIISFSALFIFKSPHDDSESEFDFKESNSSFDKVCSNVSELDVDRQDHQIIEKEEILEELVMQVRDHHRFYKK